MKKSPANFLASQDFAKVAQATFDTLEAIQIKNRWGYVAARAGWTVEMVFHEGETAAVRQRAWQVVDLFCEVVGPENLALWWSGQPTALTAKFAQNQIAKYKPITLENPNGFAMIFRMASGTPTPARQWVENAQDFYLEVCIDNEDGLWMHERRSPGTGPMMSYIRAALPLKWIRQQPAERNAAWLTERMVALMQPFWCTAGWGVVPAVNEDNIASSLSHGQQALYPVLQRFPGLNAIAGQALFRAQFNDALPSVNWLTYVSKPLLDKLGGKAGVLGRIKTSKYLAGLDLGHSLCVVAGGFPMLGDAELGVTLPPYGEAARLLKPARAPDVLNQFVAPPPSGSADAAAWQQACQTYLRRFDDY